MTFDGAFLRDDYQRTPDQRITQQDRLVIIKPPTDDTWQTGHQFHKILEVSGAKVFHDIYNAVDHHEDRFRYAGLSVEVTTITPDSNAQQKIFNIIHTYLNDRATSPMPWVKYHPLLTDLQGTITAENYDELERVWLKDEDVVEAYIQQLRSQHHDKSWRLTDEDRATIQSLRSQDKETFTYKGVFRGEATFREAQVHQDVNIITLGFKKNAVVLTTLIPWLRAYGCDVSYLFMQDYDEIVSY